MSSFNDNLPIELAERPVGGLGPLQRFELAMGKGAAPPEPENAAQDAPSFLRAAVISGANYSVVGGVVRDLVYGAQDMFSDTGGFDPDFEPLDMLTPALVEKYPFVLEDTYNGLVGEIQSRPAFEAYLIRRELQVNELEELGRAGLVKKLGAGFVGQLPDLYAFAKSLKLAGVAGEAAAGFRVPMLGSRISMQTILAAEARREAVRAARQGLVSMFTGTGLKATGARVTGAVTGNVLQELGIAWADPFRDRPHDGALMMAAGFGLVFGGVLEGGLATARRGGLHLTAGRMRRTIRELREGFAVENLRNLDDVVRSNEAELARILAEPIIDGPRTVQVFDMSPESRALIDQLEARYREAGHVLTVVDHPASEFVGMFRGLEALDAEVEAGHRSLVKAMAAGKVDAAAMRAFELSRGILDAVTPAGRLRRQVSGFGRYAHRLFFSESMPTIESVGDPLNTISPRAAEDLRSTVKADVLETRTGVYRTLDDHFNGGNGAFDYTLANGEVVHVTRRRKHGFDRAVIDYMRRAQEVQRHVRPAADLAGAPQAVVRAADQVDGYFRRMAERLEDVGILKIGPRALAKAQGELDDMIADYVRLGEQLDQVRGQDILGERGVLGEARIDKARELVAIRERMRTAEARATAHADAVRELERTVEQQRYHLTRRWLVWKVRNDRAGTARRFGESFDQNRLVDYRTGNPIDPDSRPLLAEVAANVPRLRNLVKSRAERARARMAEPPKAAPEASAAPRAAAASAPEAPGAGGAGGRVEAATAAAPEAPGGTIEVELPVGQLLPAEFPYVGGRKTVVLTAGGGKMWGRYAIMEADDLQPSHVPWKGSREGGFAVNPHGDDNMRPYHDPVEGADPIAMVKKIAAAADPDRLPLLVSDTLSPTDGPPIVEPNGRVPGGNARTMGQQLAYHRGGEAAERIRATNLDAAERFGIPRAQAETLQKPVLVRLLDRAGKRGEISRLLNQPLSAGSSAAAEAASRAAKISPTTANMVGELLGQGDEAVSVRELLADKAAAATIVERLRRDGAWTDAEVSEFWNLRTGSLDEAGKDAIERMLVARIVGAGASDVAGIAPSVRQRLLSAMGPLIQGQDLGARGGELGGLLVRAIEAHRLYKQSDLSINDFFFDQQSLQAVPGYGDSRIAVLTHALDTMSPRRFRQAVLEYLDLVGANEGGSLIPSAPVVPTTDHALYQAFGVDLKGPGVEAAIARERPRPGAFDFTAGERGSQIRQPTEDVDALFQLAEQGKPDLVRRLEEVAADVDGAQAVGARVKEDGEAFRRKIGDGHEAGGRTAAHVSDYLGGRLSVRRVEDIPSVVAAMRRRGWTVFDLDDKFIDPNNGYRAFHLQLELDNGLTAEVQVHVPEVIDVIDAAHKPYERYRAKGATVADKVEAAAEAKAIHDAAWERYKARAQAEDLAASQGISESGSPYPRSALVDELPTRSTDSAVPVDRTQAPLAGDQRSATTSEASALTTARSTPPSTSAGPPTSRPGSGLREVSAIDRLSVEIIDSGGDLGKLNEGQLRELSPELHGEYLRQVDAYRDRLARATVNDMLEIKGHGHGMEIGFSEGNPLRSRKLHVDETKFGDLLDDDLEHLLLAYDHKVGGMWATRHAIRLEADRIGPMVKRLLDEDLTGEPEQVIRALRADYAEKIDLAGQYHRAGNHAAESLQRQLAEQADKVVAIFERKLAELEGHSYFSDDPALEVGFGHFIGRNFLRLPALAFLGRITVSSMPDPANLLLYSRMRPSHFRTIGGAVLQLAGLEKIPRAQLEGLLAAIEDQGFVRSLQFMEMHDLPVTPHYGTGRKGRLLQGADRVMDAAVHGLFRTTGMNRWNSVWKLTAARLVLSEMYDGAKLMAQAAELQRGGMSVDDALARVGLPRVDAVRLNRLGIHAGNAERIANQFHRYGVDIHGTPINTLGADFDGVVHPNFRQWDDPDLVEVVTASVNSEVLNLIVEPKLLSRPLFHDSPKWGWMGRAFNQFQSFAFAHGVQLMPMLGQRPAKQSASWLFSALALGGFADAIHNHLSGRRDFATTASLWMDPTRAAGMVYASANRAGLTGWLARPLAITDKLAIGPGALLGNDVSSMAAGQALSAQGLLGVPFFDWLDLALKGTLHPALIEGKGYDARTRHTLRKAMMFQNHIVLSLIYGITRDLGIDNPFGPGRGVDLFPLPTLPEAELRRRRTSEPQI